ncbi:MAG TPA: CDP-glycerol glycerophosphotransferase family protein [Burkholderiales bacterium]|nr:CDP-glycerol glycerophosphotransferase family protein [Burkholderiales bacterium]
MRILFSGYAPVHFVCFKPLYERLSALPGVDVYMSGGIRSGPKGNYHYDEAAMYRSFDLPGDRVLSVSAIRDLDFDVLFTAHTKLILPRSVGKTIQVFHGISFRNKAVRPENMSCDHYFLVGPYMKRRFVEAGLLQNDDERAVEVGFMKTDRLLNGELGRSRILNEIGFKGDRPILLYAPTGAHDNSLEIMGEEVIRQLCASDAYDVLVKPHDHPKNRDIDWAARLAPLENDHCKVTKEPDIVRLMYVADLLISDASSAANEFTLLDRPIVFLDTPALLDAARLAQNSMLDLDTWGRKAGLVVHAPQEVCAAVEASLEAPRANSDLRQAMSKDFFYHRGGATDTAMAWLQQHVLGAEHINAELPLNA